MSFNNCNRQCNKLCPNYIISTSLTVVAVGGVDTLVIDIPAGSYRNGKCFCLIIAQSRPATATVDMPVGVSIGGDTTIVYPLVSNRTCLQATACQVNGRTKLSVIVQTNLTSGVFRVCSGLSGYCSEVLASLPAPAAAATPAVAAFSGEPVVASSGAFWAKEEPVAETTTTTKTTKTTTKKEAVASE